MTTQVFLASTAFGLLTLSAALADGCWPPATRRVLVLSANAAVPETAPPLAETPGLSVLFEAFDLVVDYNSAIAPHHPSLWRPRVADLPLVERYLRSRWDLGGGDLHLVVESIQVAPASTLCRVFADARIDVYADGLMSYGPTRNPLPLLVGARVERLLHLDLVPGLRPVLLREHGVPAVTIATGAFRSTVQRVAEVASSRGGDVGPGGTEGTRGRVAVVLGQYLAELGVLSVEEELELHTSMVERSVDAGFQTVVFKPHPSAPGHQTTSLAEAARRRGGRLVVRDEPSLVETWFGCEPVHLVVGCFSTGLLTAGLFGVPAARVGTGLLLERLRPYENSNRVPVTLVDVGVPELPGGDDPDGLAARLPVSLDELVETVSYCMQPERYPGLRCTAESVLAGSWEEVRRYVKRRRLTALGLPGSLPATSVRRTSAGRTSAGRLARAALRRSGSERIARFATRSGR